MPDLQKYHWILNLIKIAEDTDASLLSPLLQLEVNFAKKSLKKQNHGYLIHP